MGKCLLKGLYPLSFSIYYFPLHWPPYVTSLCSFYLCLKFCTFYTEEEEYLLIRKQACAGQDLGKQVATSVVILFYR